MTHQQMLASLMTQAKKQAKAQSGNGYAILHVDEDSARNQVKAPLFEQLEANAAESERAAQ